jgi:hypothetical protein
MRPNSTALFHGSDMPRKGKGSKHGTRLCSWCGNLAKGGVACGLNGTCLDIQGCHRCARMHKYSHDGIPPLDLGVCECTLRNFPLSMEWRWKFATAKDLKKRWFF